VALLIISLSVGILIGLKHRILAVIPVTLGMALMCYVIGLFGGQSGYAMFLAIACSTVSLQGGYMIGLTSRDLVGQSLARFNGARRI
jgi:hypothetical protein